MAVTTPDPVLGPKAGIRDFFWNVLEADFDVPDDQKSLAMRLAPMVRWSIHILILCNVLALIAETHYAMDDPEMAYFMAFETFSVWIFVAEYLLRIWACFDRIPGNEEVDTSVAFPVRIMKHGWSFFWKPMYLIDILAILPYFLPFMISGMDLRSVRLLRMIRILKLTRQAGALQLIGGVLREKREELSAAFFLMGLLLVVAASLMYFAENEAQPDQFSSITASLWWAVATLSTVGYGDMYPITALGKILAGSMAMICIALFGIPAGLLASGFNDALEQERKKKLAAEGDICPHYTRPYDK